MLLPPLCGLYQHNMRLYSKLLLGTERLFSITTKVIHKASIRYMGLSFVYREKKHQDLVSVFYDCSVFVLDMGDGDWHMKEEIDNSSEALKLY